LNTYGKLSVGESIASSAVNTSIDVGAKLIVVLSQSGRVASYVAKFRPGVSVLCVTPSITAARQLSGLSLGVHTMLVDDLAETEELIDEVSYELVASGMARVGDKMILVAGRMAAMKEQMRVVDITKGQSYKHIVEGGGFYFNRNLLMNLSNKH
jgi:pyruvate kinase